MPSRGVHGGKEVREREVEHQQTVHVDQLLKGVAEEVTKALQVMLMTVGLRVNVLKLLIMMVEMVRLRKRVQDFANSTVAT